MKKFYVALAAVATAFAAQAGVQVVFDGSDNAGWTIKGTSTIAQGHAHSVMDQQSNGKYRADIEYRKGDGTAEYTLDPATDKVLAIKFIGERPNGNLTLEIFGPSNTPKCTGKWANKPQGSVLTTGGNNIYYYDLTRDDNYNNAGTFTLDRLILKVADNVTDSEYTIDWIKSFASTDDIEANKDWKDDGNGDIDEAVVADMPVVDETTGKGFTAINEAFDQAVDGSVLVINKDQKVTSRLNANGRNITVRGIEGVSIQRSCKGLLFLTSKSDEANGTITIENIILDGQATEDGVAFEASSNGTLNLKNVVIKGFVSTNNQGIVSVKNGGKCNLEGVTFEDCTVPEGRALVFAGTNNVNLTGNNECSVYIEKALTINASELTNTTPITLYFDEGRSLEEAALIVMGWDKAENFKCAAKDRGLEADGEGNLKLVEVKVEDPVTPPVGAVESVEAADNAAVEYFNLQGVRVENPANGLYIRRQGANVSKVYVK